MNVTARPAHLKSAALKRAPKLSAVTPASAPSTGAKVSIGDIDLNLLRVFDSILREGSVTVAGTRLGLSQPAMSNALARLRRIFNDPLLVRTPAGMHPTPLAQRLAGPVRQALDLIGLTLAQHAGFDAATSTRLFRIHMSDIGEMVFLPPMMERLSRIAPGVRVETLLLPQDAIAHAMDIGELDIAIGFLPDLSAPVKSRPLFIDPYVCLMRSDHPEIHATLSRRQFMSASHALVSSAGTGHQVVEAALHRAGLDDRIALRVPHFTVVPMVLERSDLIMTVPSQVAQLFERRGHPKLLKSLKPPVAIPPADVRLHWHERFDHDPASHWLRELMAGLYAQ